jgi:3-dehydroquinate dehydratase / shikimate dehydrogenase
MRLCASLGCPEDIEDADDADMIEARLDLLGCIPSCSKDLLVTFRDGVDLSLLPDGFRGSVDIGTADRPRTDLEIVSSVHDYVGTPDAERIVALLKDMDGDILKGAFTVETFRDLLSIYDASKNIGARHVLLGMGEAGTVTRIRQSLLGNEFTFGYVSQPTAPGQLSISEMRSLNDDCMITGIIGRPLGKSMSPAMHEAAFKAAGIRGKYLKFDVPELDDAAEFLRCYDVRGVNVTIPYKTAIIDHLDAVDPVAAKIGAVNTIVNDGGKLTGYNTDVLGIGTSFDMAGYSVKRKRALILGSGGAARAVAHYLTENNCDITITGRNIDTMRTMARDLGCRMAPKDSVAVGLHDIIVNCTPVGMYGDGSYPININQINRDHAVFDVVYGTETPIIATARNAGATAISGSDMLAGQGAASFELWTGSGGMFDVMRGELR